MHSIEIVDEALHRLVRISAGSLERISISKSRAALRYKSIVQFLLALGGDFFCSSYRIDGSEVLLTI